MLAAASSPFPISLRVAKTMTEVGNLFAKNVDEPRHLLRITRTDQAQHLICVGCVCTRRRVVRSVFPH
jgi:hypothetical protein